MTEPYPYKKKKMLAEKINNIDNVKYAVKIAAVMSKYNPDINYTKNANGISMFFHDLSDKTYHALEKLIKTIELKEEEKYNKTKNNTLMLTTGSTEEMITEHAYKYTTKEKNAIKSKKNDSDVFIAE